MTTPTSLHEAQTPNTPDFAIHMLERTEDNAERYIQAFGKAACVFSNELGFKGGFSTEKAEYMRNLFHHLGVTTFACVVPSGDIVGTINYAWLDPNTIEIGYLYRLREQVYGRAVGRELLLTVLRSLEQDVTDVFLDVAQDNDHALALYKSVGFEQYRQHPTDSTVPFGMHLEGRDKIEQAIACLDAQIISVRRVIS